MVLMCVTENVCVLLNVHVLIRLSGDTRERRAAVSDRTRLDMRLKSFFFH